MATTLGVSQRQAQRYLAAAELPSKREAKRTLAVQRAKAQRHDAQQAREVDSRTGTLTWGEDTRTHNGNWMKEQSSNGTVSTAETTQSPEFPVKQDALRRSPPDSGLVSQAGQEQARDGPGADAGDGFDAQTSP